MMHPEQYGSACITDILASFLYSWRKWRCIVHLNIQPVYTAKSWVIPHCTLCFLSRYNSSKIRLIGLCKQEYWGRICWLKTVSLIPLPTDHAVFFVSVLALKSCCCCYSLSYPLPTPTQQTITPWVISYAQMCCFEPVEESPEALLST